MLRVFIFIIMSPWVQCNDESTNARDNSINMNDSDYMGSLKYDFLTIEALDKIRVALDLLEEDDVYKIKVV